MNTPELARDESRLNARPSREMSSTRVTATILLTTGAVAMLDQLTKRLIVDGLGPDATHHRIDLIGRHIGLEYVENTGAAFGLLAGNPMIVSALATIVAVAFVIAFASHLRHSILLQVSLGAVLAGGIGNMIDRGRLGHVIDFIAVGVWPRFNVADSAVTLGVGGMVIWLFANSMEEDLD